MKIQKTAIIAIIIAGILITGCEQGTEKTKAVTLKSPFIGGTDGIKTEFIGLREEVFDQGTDPFDVIVKLTNKGESPVNKRDVKVKITGINPTEFGKAPKDLEKNPEDDLIETRKGNAGEIIEGQPIEITFENLNYGGKLLGDVGFTIRADTCYTYKTEAISKLCIRESLLNPEPEGICEINENKPIYSSSAPIQITKLTENARSKDKIAFSIKIENKGTGDVYKRKSKCDKKDRKKENKIYVEINTGLEGLKCTGLQNLGTTSKGEVTLYDGTKTITCSQLITNKGDYEQIIGITAEYDYEETIQSQFTVKSSGELETS